VAPKYLAEVLRVPAKFALGLQLNVDYTSQGMGVGHIERAKGAVQSLKHGVDGYPQRLRAIAIEVDAHSRHLSAVSAVDARELLAFGGCLYEALRRRFEGSIVGAAAGLHVTFEPASDADPLN